MIIYGAVKGDKCYTTVNLANCCVNIPFGAATPSL
jgi:hypothetical protein